MAIDSDSHVPSSSSRTGMVWNGLTAEKSALLWSKVARSTLTTGMATPFSARKMRTRRGFGATLELYSFTGPLPRLVASVREPEMQDVAVVHHIVLAFEPEPAGF